MQNSSLIKRHCDLCGKEFQYGFCLSEIVLCAGYGSKCDMVSEPLKLDLCGECFDNIYGFILGDAE